MHAEFFGDHKRKKKGLIMINTYALEKTVRTIKADFWRRSKERGVKLP